MRKRDELTNPSSCMSRARDDEWTFVLLGRDAAAVATVRFWIEERIRIGKNKPDDAQIVEAGQWVDSVRAEQEFRAEQAAAAARVPCDQCCWGDRCDDRTHFYRRDCPICQGTGRKLPATSGDSARHTPKSD